MSTFKERLIQEQQELYEKMKKLADFICGDKFATVSETQKILLRIQMTAMTTYHTCLSERISNLEETN